MSTAQEILSAGGFQNADAIVRAANDTGLPLGIAAGLIAKESMGANVYGHDAGGALSGAGAVTQDNFTNQFMPIIRAGGTSNGVGPTQITYPGYFTQNPDLAWWDPYTNMCFGFRLMKGYLGGNYSDDSLIAAGSTYNSGSATGALDYGQTFDQLATEWTNRLQGSDTSTTNSTIQEEDMDANQAAQLDKISKWIDTANQVNTLGQVVDLHNGLTQTRPDGKTISTPLAVAYIDQRTEQAAALLTGQGIKKAGGQSGTTDVGTEIAWLAANFASVKAAVELVAKAVAATPAGTVVTNDGNFSETELVAAVQKAITGATITATETK